MPQTFYIGIKGLIIHNNKALLLKCKNSKGNDYWDLPGGRMEIGETIVDALTRELQEELPTIKNITIENLITAYKHPHPLHDSQGLMLLLYKVTAHIPKITLSNEHSEYKWVSKNEIELINQEAEISTEYREILQQSLQ